MKITTISSQRQITIPKSILEKLGLKRKDKLMLDVRGNTLVAEPIKHNLVEELAGCLASSVPEEKKNTPFSEIRDLTQKQVAKEIVNE